jgi:hypothetical protein
VEGTKLLEDLPQARGRRPFSTVIEKILSSEPRLDGEIICGRNHNLAPNTGSAPLVNAEQQGFRACVIQVRTIC